MPTTTCVLRQSSVIYYLEDFHYRNATLIPFFLAHTALIDHATYSTVLIDE
jgi:hypothetical protein